MTLAMMKNPMNKMVCGTLAFLVIALLFAGPAQCAPMTRYNGYYNALDEVPNEVLMELISRFGQTIMRASNDLENSKRTVDFGLARGYSGTQEAKHRMGLAAANFPGGPGRRRRSETEV